MFRCRWMSMTLIIGLLMLTTGCGAIFTGTEDKVRIQSNPQGATVKVDGANRGKTPTQLNLSSKENHVIRIEKDGYASTTRQVSKSLGAAWLVLDIVGGFIPVIVDAATGGWYKLNRDVINVNLSEQQSAQADETSSSELDEFDLGPVSVRIQH